MKNSTTNGHNGHANGHIVTPRASERFYDVDAEEALLGTMIELREARSYAARNIRTEQFSVGANRVIFATILQMEAAGETIDVITLGSKLNGGPTMTEIGGFFGLQALREKYSSALNYKAYAVLVTEAAAKRVAAGATHALTIALHEGDWSAYDRALNSLAAASTWGQKQVKRFPLLSSEEVEALEPPEQLIDGIMPMDALVCIFGPSATYKSFLALDMAAHIATGRDWCERKTQSGPVVYVAGEGASGLGKRHRAWRRHHGVESLSNLYTIADAPNMTNAQDTAELVESIAQLQNKPRLIVLDTLHVCMEGADENSSRDMGMFMANAKRLKKATGATVAFVHHTGNNERVRGSSSIKTDVENMIEVRAKNGLLTMLPEKVKDGPNFKPMTFRMLEVGERPHSSLVPILSDEEPDTEDTIDREAVALEVLRSEFPEGARANEWCKACGPHGIPQSTFWKVKERLVEAKKIATIMGKNFVVESSNHSNSRSPKSGE